MELISKKALENNPFENGFRVTDNEQAKIFFKCESELQELEQKFRVPINDKNSAFAARRNAIMEGGQGTIRQEIPTDPTENFEFFRNFIATNYFIRLKYAFDAKYYGVLLEEAIKEEVDFIESFIEEADKTSISIAFAPTKEAIYNNYDNKDSSYWLQESMKEYKRFVRGYYKHKPIFIEYPAMNITPTSTKVYAICNLFLPYLKSLIKPTSHEIDLDLILANQLAIAKALDYWRKYPEPFTIHKLKVNVFTKWSEIQIERLINEIENFQIIKVNRQIAAGEIIFKVNIIESHPFAITNEWEFAKELSKDEIREIVKKAEVEVIEKIKPDIALKFENEVFPLYSKSELLSELKDRRDRLIGKYQHYPYDIDNIESLVEDLHQKSKTGGKISVAEKTLHLGTMSDTSILSAALQEKFVLKYIIRYINGKIDEYNEPLSDIVKNKTAQIKDAYNAKVKATFFCWAINDFDNTVLDPNQYKNNDEKFRAYSKAMNDNFSLSVASGTLENNWCKKLNDREKNQVVKLLKEYKLNSLAVKFRLEA